jgi:hypothetical protein
MASTRFVEITLHCAGVFKSFRTSFATGSQRPTQRSDYDHPITPGVQGEAGAWL